jgi:diacylglycerol kinase family enzyme
MQRAALIVNIRSRSGEQAFKQARDRLGTLGVPLRATYALRDPVRLPETVKEAIAEEHDLIILGGGDGSVSSVNQTRTGYLAHPTILIFSCQRSIMHLTTE